MKNASKSDDWLALLAYTLDTGLLPTPAKILETFEQWEHRSRLGPRLRRLERTGLLAKEGKGSRAPCHLTSKGRLAAQGGMDLAMRWERSWDGQWRLLLFDLPARSENSRLRLWRWLRSHRFGNLQKSVWILPDPVDTSHLPLQHLQLTPEFFTVLESRPVLPDSDAALVESAWDWALIKRHYQSVLELENRGMVLAGSPEVKPAQFRQWLTAEHEAWQMAIDSDPLLPGALLPPGYLGREAYQQRQQAFAKLSEAMMKK